MTVIYSCLEGRGSIRISSIRRNTLSCMKAIRCRKILVSVFYHSHCKHGKEFIRCNLAAKLAGVRSEMLVPAERAGPLSTRKHWLNLRQAKCAKRFSGQPFLNLHRRKMSDWSSRDHVTLPNSKWRQYLHTLFIPVERRLIAA